MAPATQRAALESLLRDRKLDVTLTSGLPLPGFDRPDAWLPFGCAGLDAALLGGVPRGQVSEIIGGASSGRTSLMRSLLAGATARGELVALVDALDRFDPKSAAAAGVVLERVCWIRGDAACEMRMSLDAAWEPSRPRSGPPRQSPTGREVSRALKAVGLALSSGVFGLVVLDVADVPIRQLKGLPFTTWLRLQRLIAGSETACVLVAGQALGRSAGGAAIRLEPQRPGLGPSTSVTSFHDRVHASRHPFLGAPRVGSVEGGTSTASAGVWLGEGPVARRLRGLSVQARVQSGMHTAECGVELL
jgi:hypothetical protein